MNKFMLLSFLLIAVPSAAAQSPKAADAPMAVRIDNVLLREMRDIVELTKVGEGDYHGGLPVGRFEATFEVRNLSVKAIRSVSFDYVFYGCDGQQEIKRLPQRLRMRVAAGESVKLRKQYVGRLCSERYKVEVKRVEYEDGSMWGQ